MKYLGKVVIALLNLSDIISGRQDCESRAESSEYKERWVCRGRDMSER